MKLNATEENTGYICDGAYAHKDEMGRLWVFTDNGIEITNQICLESEVLNALLRFYINRIGEINVE
jgi:hypothetical protein